MGTYRGQKKTPEPWRHVGLSRGTAVPSLYPPIPLSWPGSVAPQGPVAVHTGA